MKFLESFGFPRHKPMITEEQMNRYSYATENSDIWEADLVRTKRYIKIFVSFGDGFMDMMACNVETLPRYIHLL